ncbi:SdrD B-like domain-containing protein, partial [Flavobacterium sp.]
MKAKFLFYFFIALFLGFMPSVALGQSCPNNLLTLVSGSTVSPNYYGGFEIVPTSNNFGSNAGTDLVMISSGNTSSGQGVIATNGNAISGGANIAPNSGSYLLIAHPKSNNDRLWYKTVSVVPNNTYQFCFYIANIKANPASLPIQIYMNGTLVTTATITTSQSNPTYTQVCGSYQVPVGVTSMEISIKDPNAGTDGAAGKSHFLALDDLCFRQITVFSLGDQVWYDYNNDGIKQANEPGIAGATLKLYDSAGVYTGISTTTDANGNYLFTNLAAGTYSVGLVLAPGYQNTNSSGTSIATDNNNDGNAVTATEIRTAQFVLSSNSVNIDFGLKGTGSVGDFVWNDTNANGVQDFGEAGIANITVNLYTSGGALVATTTTDANGAYLFSNVAPGSYYVNFVNGAGYSYSPTGAGTAATDSNANASGNSAVFTLAANENNTTIDAGLYQLASLGDNVWVDANANGIFEGGEVGLANVTVTLYNASNVAIATTTTAFGGSYSFTGLIPGTYTVTFTSPAGYTFSPQGAGTTATDSNPNASGVTGSITLISGQNDPTIDAGVFQYASVGDFVWNDLNANGIQDAGEPGINNVTVNLYTSGGTLVATTTANASGIYTFSNVVPGSYYVNFATPSGYLQSPTGAGTTATDSDANASGNSATFTLVSGQSNPTIDAGLFQQASLGDFVWNDTNNNGVQDAGEPGIAGVTVTLYNASNVVIATTTTNATGNYLFSNLNPGTYSVGFTSLPCFKFSPQGGGTAATDSNANTSGMTAAVTLASGQNNLTIDAGLVNTNLILTATPTQINCFGGTGSVALSTTGGTAPYTYAVNNPATAGLTAGTYTYSVTDAKGCSAQAEATINAAPSQVVLSATPTQINC